MEAMYFCYSVLYCIFGFLGGIVYPYAKTGVPGTKVLGIERVAARDILVMLWVAQYIIGEVLDSLCRWLFAKS